MARTLLILADDMRYDHVRKAMPFTYGTLGTEGTVFERAYCNVPVCQAARVAVLTGQYALNSGIHQNGDQGEWATGYTDTIGTWVQAGGATTGMFGKVPNGYRQAAVRPGWDSWRVFTAGEQENVTYTLSDGVGGTTTPGTPANDTIGALVESFMVDTVGDCFAWWSPSSPHVNAAITQNPSAAALKRMGWVNWDLDLLTVTTDKPTWISGRAEFTLGQQKSMRGLIRHQLRESWDLDRKIEELYDALDVAGLLATTNIIFASDGGVFYGEQRSGLEFTSSKNSPYDPAARVPLICRGPDFPAGVVNTTPVTLQDVAVTIKELHGGTSVLTPDGTSLLDFVAAPDPTRMVLYERQTDTPVAGNHPDAQGVLGVTRKLIRNIDATGNPAADFTTNPDDEYEMYDLDTDPAEKINVANDPARLTERNALEAQLDALLA